ncbi:hypothetical protein IE53DRAFT_238885 [Violaceomyces palustris]|uniref:Uncharacterized protein n=1 Tax=Violaceomyces palustris TaxID=1673888 RepID=A0ACD0P899_9BASI|nr:hypothetical protein IE53DRAFT_238885 [Violaceomyces palustris]
MITFLFDSFPGLSIAPFSLTPLSSLCPIHNQHQHHHIRPSSPSGQLSARYRLRNPFPPPYLPLPPLRLPRSADVAQVVKHATNLLHRLATVVKPTGSNHNHRAYTHLAVTPYHPFCSSPAHPALSRPLRAGKLNPHSTLSLLTIEATSLSAIA